MTKLIVRKQPSGRWVAFRADRPACLVEALSYELALARWIERWGEREFGVVVGRV